MYNKIYDEKRRNNPERLKYLKDYRNRPEIKEKAKIRYKNNKENINAKQKEYNEKNKDKIKEYNKIRNN